jgi:hypothetical protein
MAGGGSDDGIRGWIPRESFVSKENPFGKRYRVYDGYDTITDSPGAWLLSGGLRRIRTLSLNQLAGSLS